MMYERADLFRETHEQVSGPPGLLATVIEITNDMLAAAQVDDWERVSTGEVRRRQLLDNCFADPIRPEHSEVFAEALAVLLHMNEELTALLQVARKVAADKGAKAVNNGAKLAHYLEVQS